MNVSRILLFALVGVSMVAGESNKVPEDPSDISGLMFELLLGHLTELEYRLQNNMTQQIDALKAHVQQLERNMDVKFRDLKDHAQLMGNGIAALKGKIETVENGITGQRREAQQQTADLVRRMARKIETMDQTTGVHRITGSNGHLRSVYRESVNIDSFGQGWTVFQRRSNGSVDFRRQWADYRNGFGEVRGEHWLGLEPLRDIMSLGGRHELLIVLESFAGDVGYAHYDNFVLGNESDHYRLNSLGGYSGTVGDKLRYHELSAFSTEDNDNDNAPGNCAVRYSGGWWFNRCGSSFLNGRYYNEPLEITYGGIVWSEFSHSETLKSTTMMIRPHDPDSAAG